MNCLLIKRPKNGRQYTFIWIAVDRGSGKVIDFEVGDRSKGTYLNLAFRLKARYNIKHLCTDNYAVYKALPNTHRQILESMLDYVFLI